MPNGQRVGFTFTPERHDQTGITGTRRPTRRPRRKLAARLGRCRADPGRQRLLLTRKRSPLQPGERTLSPGAEYTLTGPDGTVYELSTARGVDRGDPPGGQQPLFQRQRNHAALRAARFRFIRDAAGRITTIQAPAGRAREVYTYDAAGNLVSPTTRLRAKQPLRLCCGRPASAHARDRASGRQRRRDRLRPAVQVAPITADLGGTSQFLQERFSGQLAAGATGSFYLPAHGLGGRVDPVGHRPDRRRRRRPQSGSSLQPAVPAIAGLTPIVERTGPAPRSAFSRSIARGLELLEIDRRQFDDRGARYAAHCDRRRCEPGRCVNGTDGTLSPGYSARPRDSQAIRLRRTPTTTA